MINLGLNRKISNVLSKNLNNPESDIYKEISSIAGETTESDSSVNTIRKIIENGRDSITSFVNEDITELGDYAFKDCVNLEYVYLPNCTKLGEECFQNCTSLKTLLLPSVTEITNSFDGLCGLSNLEVLDLSSYDSNISDHSQSDGQYGYMQYSEDQQSSFNRLKTSSEKLRIISYGIDELANGVGNFGWNDLEILVLPNLRRLGHSSGFTAENIIIPNTSVYNEGSAHLNGNLYVNDSLIDEYNLTDGNHWGNHINTIILPISQLPQEMREELELCQIQI